MGILYSILDDFQTVKMKKNNSFVMKSLMLNRSDTESIGAG